MSNYKFTINERLPSLNDLIGKNRTSKYLGAKFKRDVDELIINYIVNQGVSSVPLDLFPVGIKIKYYEKDKRRDMDNILSAKKYILDAMVTAEIIPGDGQRYIVSFTESIDFDKNNPRVEVEVDFRVKNKNLKSKSTIK